MSASISEKLEFHHILWPEMCLLCETQDEMLNEKNAIRGSNGK